MIGIARLGTNGLQRPKDDAVSFSAADLRELNGNKLCILRRGQA